MFCPGMVAVAASVGHAALSWPRTGVMRETLKGAMVLVLRIHSGGSSAAHVCPGVSADSV